MPAADKPEALLEMLKKAKFESTPEYSLTSCQLSFEPASCPPEHRAFRRGQTSKDHQNRRERLRDRQGPEAEVLRRQVQGHSIEHRGMVSMAMSPVKTFYGSCTAPRRSSGCQSTRTTRLQSARLQRQTRRTQRQRPSPKSAAEADHQSGRCSGPSTLKPCGPPPRRIARSGATAAARTTGPPRLCAATCPTDPSRISAGRAEHTSLPARDHVQVRLPHREADPRGIQGLVDPPPQRGPISVEKGIERQLTQVGTQLAPLRETYFILAGTQSLRLHAECRAT